MLGIAFPFNYRRASSTNRTCWIHITLIVGSIILPLCQGWFCQSDLSTPICLGRNSDLSYYFLILPNSILICSMHCRTTGNRVLDYLKGTLYQLRILCSKPLLACFEMLHAVPHLPSALEQFLPATVSAQKFKMPLTRGVIVSLAKVHLSWFLPIIEWFPLHAQ